MKIKKINRVCTLFTLFYLGFVCILAATEVSAADMSSANKGASDSQSENISVTIEGSVKNPGTLSLPPGSTIRDVLLKVEFLPHAQSDGGVLVRKSGEEIQLNLLGIISKYNEFEPILIQSGDRVVVPVNKMYRNWDASRPLSP